MTNGSFLAEARRRRVFRTGGLYAVAAAGVWGAAEVAVDALALPPWALTFVVVTTIAGFPFALILSWFFQVEPEGKEIAPEPGVTKSRAVALGLTVAIVAFVGLAASMAMRGATGSEAGGNPAFERRQITFLGNAQNPVLSPDGQWVAFHASFGSPTPEDFFTDSLMVIVPGESEPRVLAGMPPARVGASGLIPMIRWVPDGSGLWYSVYDTVGAHSWRSVPLEGGPSREVLREIYRFTFSPDGEWIAYGILRENKSAVMIRNLTTGEEEDFVLDQPGYLPLHIDWSPNKNRVGLLVVTEDLTVIQIWSIPVGDEGKPHRLAAFTGSMGSGIQWSRGGESLFYDRGGRLWRVDIDPDTGRPLEENGVFTGHDLHGVFSLSEDGQRMVLEQRQGGLNLWVFPLENDSIRPNGTQLTRGSLFRQFARLSPDGNTVAFSTFEDEGLSRSRGVSVVSTDGGEERTVSKTPSFHLAWSPDGSELAFVGEHEGNNRVFIAAVDGGTQRLVGQSSAWPQTGLSWCRTGSILFITPDRREIVAVDPRRDTETVVPKDSLLTAFFPVCSPDGSEASVFGGGVDREVGTRIIDLRTGEDRLVFANDLAFPHTWPEGGLIYAQDFSLSEHEDTPKEVHVPADVRTLGSAISFHEVSRDRRWALMAIANPTSSDVFLIEYEDGGRP